MEWISVKDRLPKPFKLVWIYWKDREVLVGYKTTSPQESDPQDCWYSIEDEKCKWNNWWMPITKPNPPKEE